MILVAGPPCGGKSTYATEHAVPGDLVLDFDDIVERITGDRYSRDADALMRAQTEYHEMVRRWFNEWEPSSTGREQIVDTTNGTHH